MELYILPKELTFRLQNYQTNWIMYSRFSPESQLYHHSDNAEYEDQYWTLVPETEKKHLEYFRIENYYFKLSIFSSFTAEPKFFHYTSDNKFDDQFSENPQFYHKPSDDKDDE
ncbi:17458_t:CDS:2 [Funneliformis caledonium]|uniref:17458_t:CDS:1 n=1 Tax=Funneliformis caledonium TaxID=1117310 RepID=A0A9N9FE15_9GLOM|nr:17458_t:CDS:2 [Funneliformis caledonium]